MTDSGLEQYGLKLVAGFDINDDKEVLMHIASYLGITEDDYFSCDVPNGDKPCGVCDDCEYLKELSDKIIKKAPSDGLGGKTDEEKVWFKVS